FRDPTIRGLAGRAETVPLTSLQRRAVRRHRARVNPAVYNVAHRVDLTGDLDLDALGRAVESLVHRHSALRMRVVAQDGGPMAEILPPFPVRLHPEDVADVDRWCQEIAAPPFVLEEAPLFRVRLGRLGPRRWVLVLVLPHLVCDGASLGIIWHELAELYAGREPARPGQHTDYARSEPARIAARYAELERFWRTELAGADLRPELPTDRPRPAALSGRGGLHESTLPAAGIGALATEAGGTPYAVLAAAFARWLAARCGRPEVVLAASTANRARPEHEGIVGMIGDVVLVRVRPDGAELVRTLSASLFAAMDHQDLPLTEVLGLVGPDLADQPFPPVLFTVVTTPPPRPSLAGMESSVREISVPGLARTELYVRILVTADELRICWEYSTDLFDAETIAAWDEELRAKLTDGSR
ncbi:MAG TPA: condensation domain-containing protein, partial [Actinophytocola sp.]|nr:condensation domain-containing protein [Actinophytocola sp.]